MSQPSLRNVKKSLLREVARTALLEKPGRRVEEEPGRGFMPGARLQITDPDEESRIATVRVSLDREVGLTRQPDGETWVTVPNVQEVIFVVPTADGSDSVEVLSFVPGVVIDAFDHALARLKEQNRALSHKAPVFIALDEVTQGDSAAGGLALKEKAQWRTIIPLDKVRGSKPLRRESLQKFRERVHREFAQLQGLDISEVGVQFTIKAMATNWVKDETEPDE